MGGHPGPRWLGLPRWWWAVGLVGVAGNNVGLQDWGAAASIGAFSILFAGIVVQAIRTVLRRRAIDGLNDLRERGATIRNAGTALKDSYELGRWVEKSRDVWHREAIRQVRRIDPNEARAFRTIDRTEPSDVVVGAYFSAEHQKQVAFMSAYLRMLEDVRKRHG